MEIKRSPIFFSFFFNGRRDETRSVIEAMLDRANYMRASPTNAQSQLSAKLLFNAQFQPGYTVIYHAGINYSAPKASNRPSHAPRAFRSSPSLS